MARGRLVGLAVAVVMGILVDYYSGNILIASIVSAVIAGSQWDRLRWAVASACAALLIWLTASYAISIIKPGALDMMSLTMQIAGFSLVLGVILTYIIALIISVLAGAAIHFIRQYREAA